MPEPSYKAWYKTSAWRRLRWSVLSEANFQCIRCERVEHRTSNLVADHITPHKGDEGIFWDRSNLQCMCKPCHDSAKQRFEKTGRETTQFTSDGKVIW